MAASPDDVTSHAQEGRIHLQHREWAAALEAFRSGLIVSPKDAELHAGAGEALYHLRAFNEAIAEFLAVIRTDPDHLLANRYLVFAIELLQGGTESVGAWCNLGATLKRRDSFEEAAVAYKEALTRKPDCLRALVELGQLYLELARPREAIPHLERAVRLARSILRRISDSAMRTISLEIIDAAGNTWGTTGIVPTIVTTSSQFGTERRVLTRRSFCGQIRGLEMPSNTHAMFH
jgi:tetratricopeptide (TPR) repeat protein